MERDPMKAAECDLISEIPKDSPIWLSSGTTPNGTVMALYVPADYEECAECGFDHYYRAVSSKMWHYDNWPSHVWLRDNTKYRIADWRVIGVGLRDSKLVHAPMPELEYQRLVSDVLRIQREQVQRRTERETSARWYPHDTTKSEEQ
jgi:hypothetical protein